MNMEFPTGFMAPHEGVQNQILDINVDYITSGCFIPTLEQQQSTSTFAETFNRSRLTYPCKLNTPSYPYNLNMNMNQDFNLGIGGEAKPNATSSASTNPAALSLVNKPKGKSRPPQNSSDLQKSKGGKNKAAQSQQNQNQQQTSASSAVSSIGSIPGVGVGVGGIPSLGSIATPSAAAVAAAAAAAAQVVSSVASASSVVSASSPAKSKLTCDICFKSNFSEMKYLKRHMQLHSVGTPYKCELCSKHYKAARYLVVHMKLVHRDDIPRFNCELCSKSFKEKYKLRRHTQRVHAVDGSGSGVGSGSGSGGGEKPFKCNVASCSQSFADEASLSRHSKGHSGGGGGGGSRTGETGKLSFPCDLCRKEFRRKINLQTHMKTKHGREGGGGGGGNSAYHPHLPHGAGKHMCQLCFQPFYCKSDFDQHLRSEPEKLLNWFKCPICSKLLNSQCLLTQHSKMHQKNHKDSCHQGLGLNPGGNPGSNNPMDMNRINLKIPNAAACSSSGAGGGSHYNSYEQLSLGQGGTSGICPDDYNNSDHRSGSFKDTKPKRYECSQCRKYLWSSNDLKVHIANFHGGDKPFQCDKCPKRWAIKKQLTEHMRSHSNERPFTCDICHLVSFKWRTDLNKHRRKYHPR